MPFSVLALVVTALLVSCAESRILPNELLENRIPIRPANGSIKLNVTLSLNNSVSDLKSALQAQVVSLEGALAKSLNKLATALNDSAFTATSALQAQVSALQSSIAALQERIASLGLVTSVTITASSTSQVTPTAISALQSRISSLRASIPSISKRATSLNTDLGSILANLRALLSQRIAALTQRVGALNLDVSALAAQVDALLSPLSDALGVTDLVALLPQQAGMLRGVMTSCEGLVQAGAANIQITKIGSSYTLAYYLVATGITEAPQAQAIYRGSPCSGGASSSLQLTGTWQLVSSVSWSLVNVVTVAEGNVADLLSTIQLTSNGDLYIGFMGSSSSLSGKLIGGKF
ncbi:hypothetical protein CLOM_g17602 [Closterium sp. NIES-68]|nr:hypothetical protein CLOM_g17602 [Closterium sp. NIES-68]GJP77149.1 hypothetical protein CLOP_g7580 [Closterium sp. NIES-67]